MSRFTLGIPVTLVLSQSQADALQASAAGNDDDGFGLQFGFAVGDGPTQFTVGPKPTQAPLSLRTVIEQLAKMLGINAIAQVADLSASWPWSEIFSVEIAPYLTIAIGDAPAVQLVVQLYRRGKYGITLGGTYGPVTVEPEFTVYDLIVGYDKAKGGLDVSARVTFKEQKEFLRRRLAARGRNTDVVDVIDVTDVDPKPEDGKTSVVKYPFPVPSQGGSNFKVKYFGLGQRFGPTVDVHAADPIKEMFDKLESIFTTNDPRQLLDDLGQYYDASRDWFVATHIEVRGWEIRAVFNDPVLYGLEITCSAGQFEGLLFEILYQKLGPHLGVYYGALTMPTRYRQINLGAVALTLPSFKIWIYTNGDFKVSVGWPLGDNSIGVQVYIFTGGCGFYFGKLRSGDNPESGANALKALRSDVSADVISYNPIVTFGIALWFGVGRSISAGPFSASLSLTVQGTFQGILAWESAESGSGSIAKTPDYFWFAASVGIVGQLQGEVDLSIVKLSVLVRLSVVAGVAFETGYGTVINVTARVDARASLKIVFITISVGFHTTISATFQITSGTPATPNGPLNPAFKGMNDWAHLGVEQFERSLRAHRESMLASEASRAWPAWHLAAPAAPVAPVEIALYFLLQPSVVYADDVGAPAGVANLILSAPQADTPPASPTDLEHLVTALASWLLRTWSNGTGSWAVVADCLGRGREQPPLDWSAQLANCLATEIAFTLNPVDLAVQADEGSWALFPMFNDLQMTWTGHDEPLAFANHARTYPDYRQVVEAYFAQLSLNVLTDNPDARGVARFGIAAEAGETPQGPSLTAFIFDDYFLTLCRQMASSLADQQKDTNTPGLMPDTALARTLGGMTSRYLMNGMRIPDPATTPPDFSKVDLAALDIAAGYALNGQQFRIDVGDGAPSAVEATLSAAPVAGVSGAALAFRFAGGGTSVTSRMPLEAPPPVPRPIWSRIEHTLGLAAAAHVAIAAIPAVHAEQVWYAARERLPWTRPDQQPGFVVPLPPAVLRQTAGAPLTLTVQTGRPQTPEPPGTQTVQPALMIQLPIYLVNRAAPGSVDASGDPANPYYTDLYRIGGTDNETRERIHAALTSGMLAGATISLLYDAPTTGYQSDLISPDTQPVVLTKTNLSTSSEPGLANAPMRPRVLRVAVDPLGPTSTLFPDPQNPDDPQNLQRLDDLLQLIWEVSVTQAGGFFLRYADANGAPLPVRIFTPKGQTPPTDGIPNGDTATITLLVTFPASKRFDVWHNAFAFTPQGSVDGTLYLGVADAGGTPLQQFQPSYPPGCIGFEANWSLANAMLARADNAIYNEDWIAALYHLMQFRVSGGSPGSPIPFDDSLWSLALSPSSDSSTQHAGDSAPADDLLAEPQTYRQVVPVYRFVANAGAAPSPYAAIGGEPALVFRVNDVFGNALESRADTFATGFAVRYNDALLMPAEWPGVRCAYLFEPGHLKLSFRFDPSLVIRSDTSREQILAALRKYASVIAQLNDPNTSVTLTQSVLPSNDGVVGDGARIKAALATFAADAAQQLQNALDGKQATVVQLPMPVAIDKTDLTTRTDNIFGVTVTLSFARPPELVDQQARTGMPRAVSVAMPLAADLDPPPQGTARARSRAAADGAARGGQNGAPPVEDVGLTWFASQFEATFAGFDGAGGTARLAVRNDDASLAATDSASLWAMRWSTTSGIDVRFRRNTASYFTLLPLNTKLMGGPADVPTFNPDTLKPTYATQIFAGVDIDAWAQLFLSAFDEILAPANACAIAALDGKSWHTLMALKACIAEALARGVAPVFPSLPGGDLAAAQDQFEQSVLATLSTAYAVSAIVQVPADVTVAGVAEPGPVPPRFFGSVAPAAGPQEPAPGCTLTSSKLPIVSSTEPNPGLLNFLVTATHPSEDASLRLQLAYAARFVEHRIDRSETSFGTTPSEWLRFVRDLPDDPLTMPLGNIDAPVPIRAFPSSPVLLQQRATQTAPVKLGARQDLSLQWDYVARLVLAEQNAQDELWLDVTYNLPVTSALKARSAIGTIEAVFEALASFVTAWPVLRPWLLALPKEAFGRQLAAPQPDQVIGALLEQVRRVACAWAAFRGITTCAGLALPPLPARAEALPVTPLTDVYVLNFSHAFDEGTVQVFAQGALKDGQCDASAIIWPTLNGQTHGPVTPAGGASPNDGACWFTTTYRYVPLPDTAAGTIEFVWPQLDIATRQTALSSWHIVRNANLSDVEGVRTNPDLIYRTPEVSFATPVVPIITVPSLTFPSGTTLAGALESALEPLAAATSASAKERLLKIALTHRYQIGAPANGGKGLSSDLPILLATDVQLVNDNIGVRAARAVSLPELAAHLAADCDNWFNVVKPSTNVAALHLDVTLFANVDGARVPIVIAPDLAVTVPVGWWPAAAIRKR